MNMLIFIIHGMSGRNLDAKKHHPKFFCIYLSPARFAYAVIFATEIIVFCVACQWRCSFKLYPFISKLWQPDSLFTYIFQLYDSRVKTTDNSLLVNYLRGSLVLENGKAQGIVSRSNVLGLHFISSSSGYGIGKYGFNGTITAGETILKVDPRILHYEIWVIAHQQQIKVLWFSLLQCAFSLSRPREPITCLGRFQS